MKSVKVGDTTLALLLYAKLLYCDITHYIQGRLCKTIIEELGINRGPLH